MTTTDPAAPFGRRTLMNLAWALAATDVALVALHFATGWDVIDLDREANLTTWYSSAKLLGIGLLSVAVAASLATDHHGRRLWGFNAALFVALSADEAASLHESLARKLLGLPALERLRDAVTDGDDLKASFAWVWLFLPLILAAVAFFVYIVVRTFEGRRAALALFFSGLGCLLAAVGLEGAILTFPPIADWGADQAGAYRLITALEESAELGGTTMIFAALAVHLGRPREVPVVAPDDAAARSHLDIARAAARKDGD